MFFSRNVGVNVGVKGRNLSEEKLPERQLLILSAIKENPYATGKEMSETLSVTQRTIERDLAELQKQGIIRRAGSDKTGRWVVMKH